MRKSNVLVGIAIIVLAAGCTHRDWDGVIGPAQRPSVKTPFPEVSDWKSVRIKLDRVSCGVGACGIPKVEIAGDGTVTFSGKFVTHIAPFKVRALVRKFQRAEFFWASDYYGAVVEDAEMDEISISFDKQEKVIRLEGTGPSEIYFLMDEVDRAAGTVDWVTAHRRR